MSKFCFHGVGQGLFYSGMIENGDKRFSFVYDCGSSGDKANLYHRIDEFIETLPVGDGGKKHLDMLILSHSVQFWRYLWQSAFTQHGKKAGKTSMMSIPS